MRTVYILMQRLRSHFKEHCAVIVFYLLGIFVCALFFTYYYGDYVKSSRLIGSAPEIMSTYTVNFPETISITDERIGVLESYGDLTFFRNGYIDKNASSDFLIHGAGSHTVTVMARKDNRFSHDAVFGSVDLSSDNSCIVLSIADERNTYSANKLKETESPMIVYDGVSLDVIGMHDMGYESCVPFSLFEDGTLPIDRIDLQLPEYLSKNDSAAFSVTLGALFPGAEVIDPYELYSNYLVTEEAYRPTQMLIAMGLMLLAVISFMFLAKYLFDMSVGENIVYRTVGAERGDIAFLALGEVLVLSLISIVAAILTHLFLYESFFSLIRLYPNQVYTASDYMFVAVASLAICALSSVPFLIAVWKRSVIQLKTDME